MTKLNESQQKAVEAIEGLVMIDAVAGSGKTTVLTHRVKNMLDSGIKPKNILLTTFTKKATEEMTERLSKLVSNMQLLQMTVGTMHSIGYRILKKEYEALNHPLASAFKKNNVLMNSKQKFFVEKVAKEIIHDRSVPFDIKAELKDLAVPQLIKAISDSKNRGIGWEEFEAEHVGTTNRMDAYVEFYKRYEKSKFNERAIDGDDMLFLLYKLFRQHPAILEKYQRQYKYIMVDEAQDNNTSQYELLRMLAYPENNLFIVGDVDQSMYGFRGARPDEFIQYSKTKGMQRIALQDNYRSRPGILDVANNLIVHNTQRLDKKLVAHNQDMTECVAYTAAIDESAEARDIVEDVKVQIEAGRKHKELAVLYRTNAQSRALEDSLIMAGLPYVIHGGISFYERKEVKDIVAYLQLAVDPDKAQDAFKRVVNTPSRFLGKAYLEKVDKYKGTRWQAITSGALTLKPYETSGTNSFIRLIESLSELVEQDTSPKDIVEYLLEDGGYKQYILSEEEEEDSSRMENIATLQFVLERYEKVSDFLDYIELMTSMAKHDIDGVQLMTIHKSKGLEFPVVYVAGVSEGTLPHFRSIEQSETPGSMAIEEERRLLYVAITRAEEECYLSSVKSFNGQKAGASRFVKELGMTLHSNEDDGLTNEFGHDIEDGVASIDEAFNREVLDPIRRDHKKMMGDILND